MNTFKNFEELIAYTEKINRFTPGERVRAGEDVYEYFVGWKKVECPVVTTLYEINQNIMAKASVHREKELNSDIALINDWYENDPEANINYMLLNNELRYYTVFSFDSKYGDDEFGSAVIDTILYLGDVLSVEPTKDNKALEIWIRIPNTEEAHVLYLFGYDSGIVSFR